MPGAMAGRRTMVIVRRADAEKWDLADQVWVGEMVNHPVWKKLIRFSEDSICCDVLEFGGQREINHDWLKGFVAGRKAQMDYEVRHGFLSGNAEEPDPERDWRAEAEEVNAERGTRNAEGSGERSVIEANPER